MSRNPGTFGYKAGTAQLFATAAAPQYLYGDAVQTGKCQLGTLSALVVCTATTASLAITNNWQVSADGTTYYNCVPTNSAANTAAVTGAAATRTDVIPAPDAAYGWKWARLRSTSSGATAGGVTDGVTISYRYSKI